MSQKLKSEPDPLTIQEINIQRNPFLSSTFKNIWKQHYGFQSSSDNILINGELEFIPTSIPGLYVNVGKKQTNGIRLTGEITIPSEKYNKLFLIYDSPSYLNEGKYHLTANFKCKVIRQYPGYLIDFSKAISLNDFFANQFSSRRKYKLKRYRKKFENCFSVSYRMYRDDITEVEFNKLFDQFYDLLKKRYDEKKTYNKDLDETEWEFLKSVSLKMMKEGSAGLFVIYANGVPVAFNLIYFQEQHIIYANTVFDIDFKKFSLGHINLMYLISWGMEHDFKCIDLSKGYFEYKQVWSTQQYHFNCVFIYDPRSYFTSLTVDILTLYLKIKQRLREKGYDKKFNSWRGRLSLKNNPQNKTSRFILEEITTPPPPAGLPWAKIEINDPCYKPQKVQILEFLFQYDAKVNEVLTTSNNELTYLQYKGKYGLIKKENEQQL